MKYTMTFALTPDMGSVLLLRKPRTHPNPLFRGRWTVPGGHVEAGEDELTSAVREMLEETRLKIAPEEMRFVLRFDCNCDPLEPEHGVAVYAVIIPAHELILAMGSRHEPVCLWSKLPSDALWYLSPLHDLVVGRMKQPRGVAPETDPALEDKTTAEAKTK